MRLVRSTLRICSPSAQREPARGIAAISRKPCGKSAFDMFRM